MMREQNNKAAEECQVENREGSRGGTSHEIFWIAKQHVDQNIRNCDCNSYRQARNFSVPSRDNHAGSSQLEHALGKSNPARVISANQLAHRQHDCRPDQHSEEDWGVSNGDEYQRENCDGDRNRGQQLAAGSFVYRFVERMQVIHEWGVLELNFEQLGFLMLQELVNFCDVIRGQFL